MPRETYIVKRFSEGSLAIIEDANRIIAEYQDQGFTLTLRQIFYQFVARDLLANRQSEYKRLGSIINDARLAGYIDWHAIEDRTRFVRANSHWDDPADVLNNVANGYRLSLWERQPYRPEVWIEKDALVGVIEGVCTELDVPYFACRGYSSQSEQWRAAQRFLAYAHEGQIPVVLHFGDHDPSGLDMTRDNRDRLETFCQGQIEVRRLALNMDQVETFAPPPNPTKLSDSRAMAYIARFGDDSWELDALDPPVIAGLIRDAIEELRDDDLWRKCEQQQEDDRDKLISLSRRWPEVCDWLEETRPV